MSTTLRFIEAAPGQAEQSLPQAVRQGLMDQPKSLPCRFFYDETGSEIFERICQLPEYYPTRTERSLFDRYADDIVRAAAPDGQPIEIVELGSGSSCKTRLLIEAALRRQDRLHYLPIDISRDFLYQSAQTLRANYEELSITAVAAEYKDGLRLLPDSDTPRLFLFLGSNIGNFENDDAIELLTNLRQRMKPSDRLLIGADLVKDRDVLFRAYNDSSGVTEAFNKNVLARIDREMEGDFDLDLWEHRAPWSEERSRIEMWLYSRCDQSVTLTDESGERFTTRFRAGEGIHTESSHKYTPELFAALCRSADLRIRQTWTDERRWFATFLIQREGRA